MIFCADFDCCCHILKTLLSQFSHKTLLGYQTKDGERLSGIVNEERQVFVMENENNENVEKQEPVTTYHYGRNESPYSREDVSGRPADAGRTGYQYYQNTEPGYGQNVYNSGDVQAQKKKKAKKPKKQSGGKAKKVVLYIVAAVVFGLIAGGVMVGVNAVGNKVLGNKNSNTEIATVTTSDSGMSATKEDGVAGVVKNVMPSIVSITNTSVQTVRSWFQSYEQEVIGSGSGIIIGQDNDNILIVTNNHVIDGAKEITVAFCDETAAAATVKGADSSADLAVLEVKAKDVDKDTLGKIKVAALGSSDDLQVGQSAIAIGNALGYGQSVTGGYISAVNREVDVEDKKMTLLQTDAAINPGNSGGALLNAKGEVIGINTAKYSTVKYSDTTVEGMGYAIPISYAIPIINDLMNSEVIEESEQGYLGIQGKAVTEEYTQGFNMPEGVYVVKIVEDSPADKCGLKAGDIITKFADRNVGSMETLQNILSNKKAGEEVEMVVQRNNEKGEYEEVTLTVKLGAKKDMPESEQSTEKEEEAGEQAPYGTEEYTPEDFFDEFNHFFGY